MTAIVALDTARRPRPVVLYRRHPDDVTGRERLPAEVAGGEGFSTPWRWTSLLLAPLELMVVAWTIPLAIFLIMVPVGLALASLLWLGNVILGR